MIPALPVAVGLMRSASVHGSIGTKVRRVIGGGIAGHLACRIRQASCSGGTACQRRRPVDEVRGFGRDRRRSVQQTIDDMAAKAGAMLTPPRFIAIPDRSDSFHALFAAPRTDHIVAGCGRRSRLVPPSRPAQGDSVACLHRRPAALTIRVSTFPKLGKTSQIVERFSYQALTRLTRTGSFACENDISPVVGQTTGTSPAIRALRLRADPAFKDWSTHIRHRRVDREANGSSKRSYAIGAPPDYGNGLNHPLGAPALNLARLFQGTCAAWSRT